MKHPDMVTALILNGGNLDAKGVKRSTQLPIEIGYKIAKYFAKRSEEANKNAEDVYKRQPMYRCACRRGGIHGV